jgi:hypothetical protein
MTLLLLTIFCLALFHLTVFDGSMISVPSLVTSSLQSQRLINQVHNALHFLFFLLLFSFSSCGRVANLAFHIFSPFPNPIS